MQMEKERDRLDNGSYLFRLNQELSGQPEINPYYAITDQAANVTDANNTLQDGALAGAVEEGSEV